MAGEVKRTTRTKKSASAEKAYLNDDGYGRIIGVGIGLSVLVVDERLVVANRMGSHCHNECLYGKSCDISHCIWLLLDTQYVFGIRACMESGAYSNCRFVE